MTSVLNNYVSVHVYIMYIGTGAGRSICSGTMNRFCSREVYKIVPLLLIFTSPNSSIIMVGIEVFCQVQLLKAAKTGEETSKFRKRLYKKQKRQDWDHKAYHDAPSAIYCAVGQ